MDLFLNLYALKKKDVTRKQTCAPWRSLPQTSFKERFLPIVGVKTGGSRVGGPDLCVKADGNRKQGTHMFTQVPALSMEVKTYFLLD